MKKNYNYTKEQKKAFNLNALLQAFCKENYNIITLKDIINKDLKNENITILKNKYFILKDVNNFYLNDFTLKPINSLKVNLLLIYYKIKMFIYLHLIFKSKKDAFKYNAFQCFKKQLKATRNILQ